MAILSHLNFLPTILPEFTWIRLEIPQRLLVRWFFLYPNFSSCGAGTINGTYYDKKACYLKALEWNPRNARAWNNLGHVGGGAAVGKEASEKGSGSVSGSISLRQAGIRRTKLCSRTMKKQLPILGSKTFRGVAPRLQSLFEKKHSAGGEASLEAVFGESFADVLSRSEA